MRHIHFYLAKQQLELLIGKLLNIKKKEEYLGYSIIFLMLNLNMKVVSLNLIEVLIQKMQKIFMMLMATL